MPPTRTDDGLRAAVDLRTAHPGLPVVVLSAYVAGPYLGELIEGVDGAVGYLLKERVGRVSDFMRSLDVVVSGGIVIDPEVMAHLMASAAGAVGAGATGPAAVMATSLTTPKTMNFGTMPNPTASSTSPRPMTASMLPRPMTAGMRPRRTAIRMIATAAKPRTAVNLTSLRKPKILRQGGISSLEWSSRLVTAPTSERIPTSEKILRLEGIARPRRSPMRRRIPKRKAAPQPEGVRTGSAPK